MCIEGVVVKSADGFEAEDFAGHINKSCVRGRRALRGRKGAGSLLFALALSGLRDYLYHGPYRDQPVCVKLSPFPEARRTFCYLSSACFWFFVELASLIMFSLSLGKRWCPVPAPPVALGYPIAGEKLAKTAEKRLGHCGKAAERCGLEGFHGAGDTQQLLG